MNSNFSYLASKCFNITSKNQLKSCTCLSVSLSVQYVIQSHNWIDFGHFGHLFVSFLQGTSKKIMTTGCIMLTPKTKEPKICHALATTSALNLKLCLKSLELRHGWCKVTNPSTSRGLIKGYYCFIPFLPLVSIFLLPNIMVWRR